MLQPQQCQIQAIFKTYTTAHGNAGFFNPLNKARDWTYLLMDTNQILHLLSLNYYLVMVSTTFMSSSSIAFFSFPFWLGCIGSMDYSRLGVKLELQLPVYGTATAIQDLRHVSYLHHSWQQCQNINPVSDARSHTHVPIDPSQDPYSWAMTGTPAISFFHGLKNMSEFLTSSVPAL